MGISLRSAALTWLLSTAPADAATFARIADASTPGGGWTPSVSFGNPALDAGQVAVRASDVVSGIHIVSGGSATTVADFSMLVPGSGSVTFDRFSDPALSQDHVAFVSNNDHYAFAVYSGSPGAVSRIADDTTLDPHGSGPLEIIYSSPDIQGSSVSFDANGFFRGIYASTDGVLGVSADGLTWLDGVYGGEIVFVGGPGSPDGTQVAYRGYTNNAFMIAVAEGDGARVVADRSTPVPGGMGTFAAFDFLVEMDGGNILFQATDGDDVRGIYAEIGGVLVSITTTVVASALAIDGDVIALLGDDGGSIGLYAFHDGVLERLIGAGDSLDGKSIVEIRFGEHGLSGDQLAFTAHFDDGTDAVYLATIPEPGTAVLLFAGLVALGASRRRQRPAR